MTGPPERVEALFDFHVHSRHSPDGRGSVDELAAFARRKGLQGFAVTDHNNTRVWPEIRRTKAKDLLIVPGMEVTTDVGHCLAIGIQREVTHHRSLAETLDNIWDAGGVGVPSHPYRIFNGVKEKGLASAKGPHFVAVEVYNARDGDMRFHNARSEHYAVWNRLGGTGGSDAHQIFEIGNAYTMFPKAPSGVDDVVAMIRKKTTWGSGHATPKRQLFFQQIKNIRLWMRRGFRPM